MRVVGRTSFILAALITATAGADTLLPGGKVQKAVTANLTPDGIDFLLDQGIGLVPDQIAVPDMSGSQSCLFSTLNYTVYQGNPVNGINVNITNATVTPQDGYFSLAISGTVAGTGTDTDGNGDSHTFAVTRVQYSGCGTSCNNGEHAIIRLNSTPFAVTTELDLQLLTDPNTGEPYVEATTTLNRDDITINMNGLDAAGCAAIDVIVSAAKGFIGDAVKDQIIDQVNETLLPAIEDGFSAIRYDDVIALGDAEMSVKVLPSALDIRTNGVAISLSSQIEAVTPTSCIEIPTGAGSAFTPGEPPQYSTMSPGGNSYDVAAAISDDFVNQLLFSAWHAGLLCRQIADTGSGPLTVEMLALAGFSGPLNRLGVPDGAPMTIVVKGYEAPAATFSDDPHVNLNLRRLEISIFTMVQDRMARISALELDVNAGANILVDAANVLTIALDVAPDDITGSVSYTEMIAGEDAEALLGLLPVIMEQFLPTLTDALPSIDLGTLAGVGLENPEFLAEQGLGGVSDDTLSAYTGLVATGACGVGGGGSGCGVGSTGGCAMGGRGAATQTGFILLALAPLGVIVARRRSFGRRERV